MDTGRTTTLTTRDGVDLSARLDPAAPDAPQDGPVHVVTHGFTGTWRRPAVRAVVERLAHHGPVLSYDLRGHGASGGESTVGAVEDEDLRTAVLAARRLADDDGRPVVTIGFSLGASVTVRHAGLHRTPDDGGADAVVAVSGPSRWNYRGTAPMRRLHVGMLTPAGRHVLLRRFRTRVADGGWEPPPLPPDTLAGRIAPTPLLLVHGDADPWFPLEHALWLHEAAGPTSTLWVEPGMGHAETATTPTRVDRIAAWARDAVAASARMRG